MDWVWLESFWLICPAFADVFVRSETFEGLETASVIIGVDEVIEVRAKLLMAVIMVARDCGLLDGAVHSLDPVSSTGQALSVRPWVLDLGCPVIDAILAAGAAKYVQASDAVLFAVGKLDAIVGKNSMNDIRQCLDEIGQERRRNHLCGPLM